MYLLCLLFVVTKILVHLRKVFPNSLVQNAKDVPPKETIVKTKQYLSIIGTHIDKLSDGVNMSESRCGAYQERLWEYVAEYSNLKLNGERIAGIYTKLKEKKAAAAAAAGAAEPTGTEGAG